METQAHKSTRSLDFTHEPLPVSYSSVCCYNSSQLRGRPPSLSSLRFLTITLEVAAVCQPPYAFSVYAERCWWQYSKTIKNIREEECTVWTTNTALISYFVISVGFLGGVKWNASSYYGSITWGGHSKDITVYKWNVYSKYYVSGETHNFNKVHSRKLLC